MGKFIQGADSDSRNGEKTYPRKLYVETTSRCNLGCFMCVKHTEHCSIAEGDLSPAVFDTLEPAFPHLEALILNGIGEPLLHPRLEEFIRRAHQIMPPAGWIGFQSNGLLLTNLRAISLVEAGLGRICISIDASSPETFRNVRGGGELVDITHAFNALASAKERCGRPDVAVGIEFVLMRKNLQELPEALRWAAAKGASFAIITHLLPYDSGHGAEAAYETCTDAAIDLFTKWRVDAERQGIDIDRYFEARWKYARNPEERRIVAFIETLKEEAVRQGIFVDLKKLLRIDSALRGEVAEVFAKAEEVARETGIELRLPGTTLREARHCSFVEDGSAFVSWEGRVSPCYFLWHSYRCYASGWPQQVQQKVFGSLEERGILDIWNDAAFRSFRKSVLSYDYPGCSNCTLAPCDYVQTNDFQQDCHIKDVPCGSCLWCTGVFQCLR